MKKKLAAALLAALLLVAFCAAASAATGYYVTGGNVRIRSGPGTDYEILGHVTRGDYVEVNFTSGGWAQINLVGLKHWLHGYVSTKYLSRTKPTASYTAPAKTTTATTETGANNYRSFVTANYYVIVNPANTYVNMRWEASKSAQVRRIYYYGAQLRVIAENASWCQVYDESTGEVGFILKSLLLKV